MKSFVTSKCQMQSCGLLSFMMTGISTAPSQVSVVCVVKPAFQMAYTEDIIRRNPFDFRLDIIPNNTQKRVALPPKQQE